MRKIQKGLRNYNSNLQRCNLLRVQIMFGGILEQFYIIDYMFYFIDCGGLRYIQLLLYYIIDIFLEWVFVLRFEKVDFEIGYLLEMIVICNFF